MDNRNPVRNDEEPRLAPQLGVGLSLPWQTLAVVGAVAVAGLTYFELLGRLHR